VTDKRDNYRHLKRLPIKFGVEVVTTSGFTKDIPLLTRKDNGRKLMSLLCHVIIIR
jgi:hypothetical protein